MSFIGFLFFIFAFVKEMIFSKTVEYAIRAMIFIAQKSKKGIKVGIKEIAKATDAPEYFIGKILQDLSRKGLVQSLKGPTGGFYLEEESSNCSLADIVKAIDGNKLFTGCGLGLKSCSEIKPCPIHNEFKKVREDIYNMLEDARIGEFSKKLEKKLTFLRRK
ncbi:RrF2 family transcriptional regulator [Ginsengibacter hankyongi]|uniref:RrF2 family transcriptional regulator n=1 Tax=Ginsengibacter hankyongi TaxID=2607284 RepID=UPI001F445CC9|nr:Rrf2 family transcriptional regulator [Ginsengibacter hankyongi]